MKKTSKTLLLTLGIGTLLIVFDQAIKKLAIIYLTDSQKICGLYDFFCLNLHYNKGIAFSIPINGLLTPSLALIVLSFVLIKFSNIFDFKNFITNVILVLIYSGAISNIIDRLAYGAVVDYISIGIFPVFNIADSFITVACFLIIVFYNQFFKSKN